MRAKIFLFLSLILFCCSVVFAFGNSNNEPFGGLNQINESLNLSAIAVVTPKQNVYVEPYCQQQLQSFLGREPKDLVKEYCSAVNTRIIWLLTFAAFLILFKKLIIFWATKLMKFRKDIADLADDFKPHFEFIMNWIILGLIFIACFAIYKTGGM